MLFSCVIEEKKLSYYESVFIARPDITAAQVESLTESLKQIIVENGGAPANDEYWGLKSLAYKIKKNRKGHYTMIKLEAPPAAIKELERNMRLNEDILRFLTIKVDSLEEEPSVMIRNKGPREDRVPQDNQSAEPDNNAYSKEYTGDTSSEENFSNTGVDE
tara:strand:- start:1285 stop:1767 length:483 start_codon:yes stop_codon:yes gene_type:complete